MVLFANLEKLLRNAFDSVGAGVDERRGEGLYGRPLLGLAPRPPLQDKAYVSYLRLMSIGHLQEVPRKGFLSVCPGLKDAFA